MTTGDVLLNDIIADPSDDAARLIYADWLSENGDADRAAFIRASAELPGVLDAPCERAAEPHGCAAYLHADQCPPCKARRAVRGRMEKSSDQGRRHYRWLDGPWWDHDGQEHIPAGGAESLSVIDARTGAWFDPGPLLEVRFRLGFPSVVRCRLGTWERYGPRLVATQPVERVEATDRRPSDDANGWNWIRAAQGDPEWPNGAYLPPLLFDSLGGGHRSRPIRWADVPSVAWFGTESEANDALSEALLLLAGSPSARKRRERRKAVRG